MTAKSTGPATEQDEKANLARIRELSDQLEEARSALAESRARLDSERLFSKGIISALPGLFFMIDEEGRYHRWNNNLEKQLGFSAEEILMRDFLDFVPETEKERIRNALDSTLKNGSFSLEYNNQAKDGQSIPYFAQSVSLELDGRRFVLGVELDMSELKRAEQALRQSEEHLRSLMETATNFVVYRLSFEEGDPEKARVVFVSPSIVDILGPEDPDTIQGWFANIHPEDRDRIMKAHFRLPRPERTEETMRIFHPLRREWRWVQFLSTSITDRDGVLLFSNGIIIDVTAQALAEQALRRKEEELQLQTIKLAKTNTALQVIIEHREEELANTEQNILNTLKHLVEPYLNDLARTPLNEEQRTYLEIIGANIDRISRPLSKKLTSWQQNLTPTEIKVADLIRNGKTTKEIAELMGLSNFTISYHRKNIRVKLGLAGRKANLAAHLQFQD